MAPKDSKVATWAVRRLPVSEMLFFERRGGCFNTSEKYARQIGAFPQQGVKIKNF